MPHPATAPCRHCRRDDRAASAVIGVILMVAITVVLGATVFVWAQGFGNNGKAAELASVWARGGDSDGDRMTDYIRVMLVKGDNAPYGYDESPAGVLVNGQSPAGPFDIANGDVCLEPPSGGVCTNAFGDPGAAKPDSTYDVGQTLYIACRGYGTHTVSLTLKGSVNFEWEIDCIEANP